MSALMAGVLLMGFASSCSDDDDNVNKLQYKGYIVEEFQIYVGSPEGGKPITVDKYPKS